MSSSVPAIALTDIGFSYEAGPVFRSLSLAVQPGEYLGVIGSNGGGKSTLLQLMLGLLPPASGTVALFGDDVRTFRDWHRIAYVSQNATNIDPAFPLTVEDVVALGRHSQRPRFGRMRPVDHAHVQAAMQKVDITPLRTRRIGDLSGGQRQRVFLARALAGEPDVLVLDEPTTGVDARTQEQLYALLRRLHRDAGLTIILASHDIAALAREASAIVVVQQGLLFFGTPAELLARPDYERILREVECYHHH